jgi:glutaredoxin 2
LVAEWLADVDINDFLAQDALWHEQSQLAAIDDVIEHLDELMAQRTALQARRQRGDAEIFAITRAITLQPWFDAPEYVRAHERLVALLGLADLFPRGTQGPVNPGDERGDASES